MYLFEFDDSRKEEDQVDAILVAAKRLEDLQKTGKIDDYKLHDLNNLVKFLNKYLTSSNSSIITLSTGDIRKMVSSPENPFKKSIKNIQGEKVIFKGEEEVAPPESPPPEQSKEVVGKMAKSAMR